MWCRPPVRPPTSILARMASTLGSPYDSPNILFLFELE